jgi:hypothetical protein
MQQPPGKYLTKWKSNYQKNTNQLSMYILLKKKKLEARKLRKINFMFVVSLEKIVKFNVKKIMYLVLPKTLSLINTIALTIINK